MANEKIKAIIGDVVRDIMREWFEDEPSGKGDPDSMAPTTGEPAGKGEPKRTRRVREQSLKAYALTAKGRKFKGALPGTIQNVFDTIKAHAPVSARKIERLAKLKKKTVESHVWKLRRRYQLIESVDRTNGD